MFNDYRILPNDKAEVTSPGYRNVLRPVESTANIRYLRYTNTYIVDHPCGMGSSPVVKLGNRSFYAHED